MTQTPRFVCVACEERAGCTFTTAYPTLRGHKDTHWQESAMQGGRLGGQGNRAVDKTDRHHGGRLWRSRPSPELATPTTWFGLAVKKKAGVVNIVGMLRISILYKDIPGTSQG